MRSFAHFRLQSGQKVTGKSENIVFFVCSLLDDCGTVVPVSDAVSEQYLASRDVYFFSPASPNPGFGVTSPTEQNPRTVQKDTQNAEQKDELSEATLEQMSQTQTSNNALGKSQPLTRQAM